MVVQHNLTAMNSNRMLGLTQNTLSSSTEKLSSGYQINRAADDAAGLAISEKMRKQIRGLTQASDNAEDGISAVQTAEGALTEVHDMLQRMNELAVQAANGTNSETDRSYIQDEVDQLVTEIDRVAETTKFNEIYLLKGNGSTTTKTLDAQDAGLAGTLTALGNGKSTFEADSIAAGDTVSIGGTDYTIVGSSRTDDYINLTSITLAEGDTIVQNGVEYTVGEDADNTTLDGSAVTLLDSDGNKVSLAITAGATITSTVTDANGDEVTKTRTIVGSADLDVSSGSDATAPTWAAGDTIVDKDGVEYTYVDVSENAWLNDVLYTSSGFYKTEGNTASDTAYTPIAGDTYTIAATGETGSISNKGIQEISDVQDMIRALDNEATVKVYDSVNATAVEYTIGVTSAADGKTITADDVANLIKEGQYVEVDSAQYYVVPSASESETEISVQEAYQLMAEELTQASSIGTDVAAKVVNNGDGTFDITQGTVEVDSALNFSLHVGADADMTNKIGVNIETMSAANLGVKGINVSDDSGQAATYAIDSIANAIEMVSRQRSALGAVQNRLEHTINNLDNIVENTTSAESAIRDTDMATDMVTYSNANILAQAGQSMLAQANQSNQGVLSLLG
ncbi:MAG: flagellar hook protein [Lachnospiraceae bacterium]|nr:flagellar hook protein [Lachnospiraceae bacterium]